MNTLDCKDIKALLSGLVDDQIDPQVRHEAERHMADCRDCRELVSEAEGVNDMLALEAQRMLWPAGLPSGFEQTVLSKTVYAEPYQFAGRRWTSWLGWVAAAASLLLAMSIWVLDRQHIQTTAMSSGPNSTNENRVRPVTYSADRLAKSTVLDDASYHFAADQNAPPDEKTIRAVDFELAFYQPSLAGDSLAAMSRRPTISRDDADTLFSTSNLLEMLQEADLRSFAAVDRIRQIAEYDDLLSRLAQTRQRLSPEDRPAVLAAESILLRIVRGPINLDDLQFMHDTVASMNLSSRVSAISNRWESASSL